MPKDYLVQNTLNTFFFIGFSVLKIFQKCHYSQAAMEVDVHDNFIDFEKILSKMLDYFQIFLKIKTFKNFLLYSNYVLLCCCIWLVYVGGYSVTM